MNNTPWQLAIVDDDESIHQVLEMVLSNQAVDGRPIAFHHWYSFEETKRNILDTNIDAVLLDIIMESETAGFECVDFIRNQTSTKDHAIVIMSGQPGVFAPMEVMEEYAINGYIPKSELKIEKLYGVLTSAFRHSHKVKQLHALNTALTQSQIEKENEHRFLTKLLNSITDAIVVIDAQGNIVQSNPAIENVFGYQQVEVLNRNIAMLMPEPFASNHHRYMQKYQETKQAQIIGKGRELPGLHKDGHTFSMELVLSELSYNDRLLFIGIVRDITDRKEAEKNLFELAYYDKVTRIPNQRSLEKELPRIIEKAKNIQSHVSLYLIDIDKFYRFNQAFGFEMGDQILNLITKRIQTILPPEAQLFRASGTSFIATHSFNVESNANHDTELATQLLEAISGELNLQNKLIHPTVTIGIYSKSSELIEDQVATVLNKLELAVRHGKEQGGDRFSLFDDVLEGQFNRHYLLESELKSAIERNELSLVYQPQFNNQREPVSAEALIRWHSEKLGFVSPAEFIPLAEQTGLIVDIGQWVLETALLSLSKLNQDGFTPKLSVNISVNQIIQTDFCEDIKQLLDHYQIAPNKLMLEITETTLASEIDTVIDNINRLTEIGIEFSIDDFGTGYSSLAYLHSLPINELKIDKSFIDHVENSEKSQHLVNTVISMAKNLELTVVAEGVENEAQHAYLDQHQCDIFQGYLHSKPLSYENWRALLATQ